MVMRGILFRYIGKAVLLGTVLVAVLLVGLYTLVEVVRQAQDLTGDYGPFQMMLYLAQTTPRRLYDIFPFAALIGTLIGLGGLAATNELVAMRAAGFDRRQVMTAVLAAVGGCLIVLMLMGELLVPGLEARASAERDQARSGQVHLGRYGALWLRDGRYMVRIGYSAWSGDDLPEFGNMLIYEVDSNMQPQWMVRAEAASHNGSEWQLRQVEQRRTEGVETVQRSATLSLGSTLSYDLFASAVTRPRMLAITDLREMIALLEANEQDTAPYEQAMWNRVFFPVNVLAMVLISLPFVFRGGRQTSRGLSLFAGVSLGLLFFVVSRLARGAALLWPGPLWLPALLPALLFAALGLLLLRRL